MRSTLGTDMVFTKISVLIPTRQRIERLRVMLASYAHTTRGAEDASELVFRADDDDLVTHAMLADHKVFIGPRYRGYHSSQTFFNEALLLATGDVLMCGNDDMVFRSMHWAPKILEAANQYPDGLFDLGVMTYNETHYPFSVVSRKAVDTLGFICDPRIHWSDIFLRDTMGTLGRCVMLPDVHIDHDWAGLNPDHIFIEGNQNDIYRTDPTYWAGTHARAVQDAVEKLRCLL